MANAHREAVMDPRSGKPAALAGVEAAMEGLTELSEAIHSRPELAFEETHAAGLLTSYLGAAGFQVEEGICGLPTAFRASVGNGGLHIALCAEYDALPGIGHACGHNIIAACALGAAKALAPLVEQLDATLSVFGTPAEEGGGGKILMLERGGFDGVAAAMMVHPWPEDRLAAECLAVDHLEVRFTGRSAHASAAPWEGLNAADAMVVSQVAIGLARQHMHPGDQVHGIVSRGGDAPNVIPASTTGEFMVRSHDLASLAVLRDKITRCFEAGALATGTSVDIHDLCPTYSQMRVDPMLIAAWRRNAESLGRRYEADDARLPLPTLSTDMANVSLRIPAIHPLVGLSTSGAVNHQPEFAACCIGGSANKAIHDGAASMALTAIDACTDAGLRTYLENSLEVRRL